jgi:DNA invertase Pin-like site-specific DNA recombinase
MAAGCTIIRSEKVSGTSRDGRTELQIVLDFIRSSVPTTSVVRGCHHGPSLSEAH